MRSAPTCVAAARKRRVHVGGGEAAVGEERTGKLQELQGGADGALCGAAGAGSRAAHREGEAPFAVEPALQREAQHQLRGVRRLPGHAQRAGERDLLRPAQRLRAGGGVLEQRPRRRDVGEERGEEQAHHCTALRMNAEQPFAQVGPLQRIGDVGLQVAEPIAGVVPLALEAHADQPLLLRQHGERVGELDLAARARLHLLEDAEDVRRQDIPADDREVGGRGPARRLLDDLLHLDVAASRAACRRRRRTVCV